MTIERDFKGVWIPKKVWSKNYSTFENREIAIFKHITGVYGIEIATAGGIKNGK